MNELRTLAIGLVIFISMTTVAQADVPQLINYQGFLTDTLGDTVPDGNYSVTFRIYDVPTGGSPLWEEGSLVAVQGGLFAVILGSITPVSPTLFDQSERYLGVQVGLDPELAPRSRLVMMPYAGHAASADVATTSLDKTTDATELTSGTLDTARFSAHDDLLSEDRVGDSPAQLALGDHSHIVNGVGTVIDTTSTQILLDPGDGEVLLKTLTIPANSVVGFLRVFCQFQVNGTIAARFYINGQLIITTSPSSSEVVQFTLIRAAPDIGWKLGRSEFTLDTDNDMILTITGQASGSPVSGHRVYTSWVEFGAK